MPNKNDKKVILISGKESNWYEQAIFIINENASKMPVDMVKEAENIIKKYIAQTKNNKSETFVAYKKNIPEKKIEKKIKNNNSSKANKILNTSIFLCCILTCFLMYLVFKL